MAVRRLPCKPRLPASEPDTMPRAFNPAFRYSRTIAALLLAILAAFAALPALANNIDTRLVVEGPVARGETVTLAIAQQPKPTWHGYWLNPGDAGFGMDTIWTLPEGWSVGGAEYPVPEPLVIGTLMNHVYEGPYAILVPLTVPADAKAGETMQIGLEANWLACTDEICVPEKGTFTAQVTVADADSEPPHDPQFDEWRAHLPAPLAEKGRYALNGETLRIAVPVAPGADVTSPHLFPAADGFAKYIAPQSFSRNGNWLIVETGADDGAASGEPYDAVLRLGDGTGLAVTLEAGDVPAAGEPVAGLPASGGALPGLAWLLLLAFAGGVILNVMPCVFPILSLKAISLAKANEQGAHKDALAYTAGIMVAVLLLGAVLLGLRAAGEEVGWAFQLQEPATIVLLLILASAITANLAGLFEMMLPIGRSSHGSGAFLTGLLAAFVATPCTGPFMAAAMGAALLLPVPDAMLLFAALGLGLAFPFLLIGFVPSIRRLLPKPGAWMNTFRRIIAVPMGLTALALVWLTWRIGGEALLALGLVATALVLMLLFETGRRQKLGLYAKGAVLAAFALALVATAIAASMQTDAPAVEDELDATEYSEAALAEARASGKPVFAYFTADWCVTCKVNEATAINREDTKLAFEKAGVVVIRGDWTRRDATITRYLESQGAAGVPLYVWYAPGRDGEVLPQILTVDALTSLASGD